MPKIISVISDFRYIYRVTLENEAVLDLFGRTSPVIGAELVYSIEPTVFTKSPESQPKLSPGTTVMNGEVVSSNNSGSVVSFGGFIAKIPQGKQWTPGLSVTMTYFIK